MKVLSIYCDEDKVRSALPGENVRVKLSGIEEEDITAGFVLSSVSKCIFSKEWLDDTYRSNNGFLLYFILDKNISPSFLSFETEIGC